MREIRIRGSDPVLSRRTFIAAGAALGVSALTGPASAQRRASDISRASDIIRTAFAAPDLALVNGRFVDYRGVVGDTLLLANGRIHSVGFGLALDAALPAVDLGGRTVIPGFVDAHVHFTRAGVNPGHQERRVERAFSIAELKETIAARAENVPRGEMITCIGGWNPLQLREARLPTRAEVDDAAPDHAVYLASSGRAGAVTNGRGAAFFAARGVAVDAETGVVASQNDALAALRAEQTDEDRLRGTAELNAYAASMGLTTVVNAGNFDDQRFPLALWRDGRLDVRMRPLFPADSPDEADVRARQNLEQGGRAVGDDLYRPAGFGERIGGMNTMSDAFEPTARVIARHGWLLQQHSITSEENAFHIEAFGRIAREYALAPLHWSLLHLQEISDEHLDALGRLGAGASAQTWTYLSSAGGPPFRRIVDSGIPAGVGTDSTNVAALDPWLTLFYMTTGRNLAGELTNDGQQISRLEALRLYTQGAAWFCFDDDKVGSFEAGKLADLAVLSADFLTVADEELRKIESLLTLVGGRVVHASAAFA
ncbi:MAG TPA: amidohydrolase family protein [Gammaproteobacteria bacterium]